MVFSQSSLLCCKLQILSCCISTNFRGVLYSPSVHIIIYFSQRLKQRMKSAVMLIGSIVHVNYTVQTCDPYHNKDKYCKINSPNKTQHKLCCCVASKVVSIINRANPCAYSIFEENRKAVWYLISISQAKDVMDFLK